MWKWRRLFLALFIGATAAVTMGQDCEFLGFGDDDGGVVVFGDD